MPKDDFLSLRNAWYAKLAAEGFEDIEKFQPNELEPRDRLRGDVHGSGHLRHRLFDDMRKGDATAEYYRLAGHFFWGNDWSGRKQDKRVWELRKDGATIREIEKAMGWRSRKKTFATVKRLEAEMMTFVDKERESDKEEG